MLYVRREIAHDDNSAKHCERLQVTAIEPTVIWFATLFIGSIDLKRCGLRPLFRVTFDKARGLFIVSEPALVNGWAKLFELQSIAL